jgi:succinyl-diaminopimelate desuccinylase
MPLSGLNTAPAVARLLDGLSDLEIEAIESTGENDQLGWPSFTPTVIQAPSAGPAQLNVVPGQSRVLADIRTIPGQSHDRIRSRLTGLASAVEVQVADMYARYDKQIGLQRKHGLIVAVDFLTDRPCTFTDIDQPVVRAADWATKKVTTKTPRYGGVPGATDGTFLWSMKNIPIVTMGAGDRQVPHQTDEWVDLDQLTETSKIYALTAMKYLNPREAH